MEHKNYNKALLLLVLNVFSLFLFSSCRNFYKKKEKDKGEVIKPIEEGSEKKKYVYLDSDLKYQILKEGKFSEQPIKAGQKITVHYAGWLQDKTKSNDKGTKFDSSVDRGRKFTFTIGVGQVIKGWDRGIEGMRVGEKRKIVIPYQLAYGERGIPHLIPPKSTLIFEVELFNTA